MINREEEILTEAKAWAKRDGHNWDDLNDIMHHAYIHNAEAVVKDRYAGDVTAEDSSVQYLIIPETLPGKTIKETAEVAREIIRSADVTIEVSPKAAEKPRELKPGEYLCSKCNSPHRKTSKIGKKHLE